MPTPVAPSSPKTPLKERLQNLFVEYGSIALWTYVGIFAVVLVGFALAIQFGVEVKGTAGAAGTWAAAYVATKLAQPLRILGTLLLTPVVVRVIRWRERSGGRAPKDPGTAPSPRESQVKTGASGHSGE